MWTLSPEPEHGRIAQFFLDVDAGAVINLAADHDGNVYFADRTGIRVKRRDGSVSLIVDSEEYGISVGGMAVDEFGRIWFSDLEHRRVRVLEPIRQAQ